MAKLVWKIPKIEEEAIVVTFDMCSSSTIIEDLTLSGDVSPYMDLLRDLKHHLASIQRMAIFRLYKFIGDGWILLYPSRTDGVAILDQLEELSNFYRARIGATLKHLQTSPQTVGLTFGIDVGRVAKATIFQTKEWIGRPINVACRLQGAVMQDDGLPPYRALASNPFYMRYLDGRDHGFGTRDVERNLRNISGGAKYVCKEISFPAG